MDLDHITNENSGNTTTDNNLSTMTTTTSDAILKSSYDIDVVRLIGQHLLNLGLKQTATLLLEESGLSQLDHPLLMRFRELMLMGELDKASELVEDVVDLIFLTSETKSNGTRPEANTPTNKQQNGRGATIATNPSSDTSSDIEQKKRANIESMRLAIAEQKFLELLDDNERIKALRCLRCEITPLCKDVKRVQFLTALLMCRSIEEIRLRSNWSGKNQQTRQQLFDKLNWSIPPPLLLPPKRLETLLHQAVLLQKERCILHVESSSSQQIPSSRLMIGRESDQLSSSRINHHSPTVISDLDNLGCIGSCSLKTQGSFTNGYDNQFLSLGEPPSSDSLANDSGTKSQDNIRMVDLKSDHICYADRFPLHAKQALYSHKSDVWYCKFSNDGNRLATAGASGMIIIWVVDVGTSTLNEKCTLDCSNHPISCLSWSPDDAYLLASGSDEKPLTWIWNMETEKLSATISPSKEDEEGTTFCSWHMSGRRFAAGSIKGTFHIYDVHGMNCGKRDGVRVQCLSFLHKDPNILLAADTLNRIKAYRVDCHSETENLSNKSDEEDLIEERFPIMSFVVDLNDKYMAVNVKDQGVNLYDLRHRTLLRIFVGVSQRDMIIYSSFSSLDSIFLASGSEDGRVYIYHISREQPVAVLNGHRRCVNCVSWNQVHHGLLASVSEDQSVRLWAPIEPGRPLHLCRSLSKSILFSH